MIQTLKNIYQSPDLMGDSLLLINQYSIDFPAKKIAQGSPLAKIAWTITAAVYWIFAALTAPVLVPLGMGVKTVGVVLHNRIQIKKLQTAITCIQQGKVFPEDPGGLHADPTSLFYRPSLQTRSNEVFTQSNFEEVIQRAIQDIQSCSWKCKQVYAEVVAHFPDDSSKPNHVTLHTLT